MSAIVQVSNSYKSSKKNSYYIQLSKRRNILSKYERFYDHNLNINEGTSVVNNKQNRQINQNMTNIHSLNVWSHSRMRFQIF